MMQQTRRILLALAVLATSGLATLIDAPAQGWSSKPVRHVVTFPSGGANDIIARLLGQQLSERQGQPFIIDNRGAAGGNTGAAEVVHSAPDGYTLPERVNNNETAGA